MYNSASKLFSAEFKTKALVAVEEQISLHKAMSDAEFGEAVGHSYYASDIKRNGHRWQDPEQVYQSLISCLENRLRESRGPGSMNQEEAAILEVVFMRAGAEYMFELRAKEAVKNAAGTDQWYMFEKQWD